MQSIKTLLLAGAVFFLPFLSNAQENNTKAEKERIEHFISPQKNSYGFSQKAKTREDFRNRYSKYQNKNNEIQDIYQNLVNKNEQAKSSKFTGENIGMDELQEYNVIKNQSWGTATLIDDGSAIYFSQKDHFSLKLGFGEPYYKGTSITILNEELDSIASFSLQTADTTQVISVQPMVSRKFFNTDNKLEFMIHAHSFEFSAGIGPISCRDTLYIVNEDGLVLQKYGNVGSSEIHQIGYSRRLLLYRPSYSELYDSTKIEIYDVRNNAKPMHTVLINDNKLAYAAGPVFSLEKIDNKEYYISSFYEKPFDSAAKPENPVISKNNKFIIQFYSASDFKLEKEIKLDIFGAEKNEWSMAAIGDFKEHSITTKYFNSDEKMELIYSIGRYEIECDCIKTDMYLVNEDGEILKEIMQETGGTQKLQTLAGHPEEYAVFMGGEGKVNSVRMMEMPSFTFGADFPPLHEGEYLSLSFDRVVDANGGIQYVFASTEGEIANNTVYAGVMYFDKNGKLIKKARIDVGIDAALVTPIITPEVLNPYLINSNDEREYLLFGKDYDENDQIVNYFAIGTESKGIQYKTYHHAQYGTFSSAGTIQNTEQNRSKALYLIYSKENGEITTVFHELPLEKNSLKGSGTKADPYVITNPAELDKIRENRTAYYILGNDIDMTPFTGLNGQGFIPIGNKFNEAFEGHLDGKNHTISNLFINDKLGYETGLFASISNKASISNLFLKNPNIQASRAINIGNIAGLISSEVKIINCHVEGDMNISGTCDGLGGIVGQAYINASIEQCSYQGHINAPASSSVGGILGVSKTGARVQASYTTGSISSTDLLGGIVGSTNSNGSVTNCYSTMDITGGQSIGGIVGSNNGKTFKNYATGNISSSNAMQKFAEDAGGIVGYVDLGMFYGEVKRNVALNTKITADVGAFRIGNGAFTQEGEYPQSTMDSNYALSTMIIGKPGEEAIVNDAASCKENEVNGASKSLAEMNQSFYESLGWQFGKATKMPWKMVDGRPHLWYEYLVRSILIDKKNIQLNTGEETQLYANVSPASAENKLVLWESSDPTIASIDQTGKIKAKKRGEVIITAISDDGDFTATCTVKVVQPITSIVLEKDQISVGVEEYASLNATILPQDADNKILRWRCQDEKIAVAFDGTILGMEVGKTLLIVSSDDGKVSDTCLVSVVIPVERILLDKSEISMTVGETSKITASVRPTDASNQKVNWTSSDTTVAKVSNGIVRGIKKGSTLITATSDENDAIKALCEVIVNGVGIEDAEHLKIDTYISKGILHIQSEIGIQELFIIDLSGRILQKRNHISNHAEISVQELPEGIYLLKLILDNGSHRDIKLIK